MTALSEVDALIAECEDELDALRQVRSLLLEGDDGLSEETKGVRRQLIADRMAAQEAAPAKGQRATAAYRFRLVRECQAGRRGSVARIAEREGMPVSTLYAWIKRYGKGAS